MIFFENESSSSSSLTFYQIEKERKKKETSTMVAKASQCRFIAVADTRPGMRTNSAFSKTKKRQR